jgi:tetratricopeptide (TPR) repeat protein
MRLLFKRVVISMLIGVSVSLPLRGQTIATVQEAQQGWQALQAGDADRADTIFRQALVSRPNDELLTFGAGAAAHLLGRDDDAERLLKRTLVLNPRLADAAKWLGDVEYAMGNLDDAIVAYEQALAQKPADAVLRQRLEAWQREAAIHRGLTQRNDGRFSIIFEGNADSGLADRALATLDAAFWRIGGTIGAYPSSSIMVTLYSERQFRDVTGAPEWADGVFDGKIRIPVQGARQNLAEFDRVLVHELTHAMVSSLAPHGVPTWLHEGLASYFEPRDLASALRVLRVTGIVPTEVLFDSFTRLDDRQAAAAYAESLLFADLLMKRAGTHMGIVLQSLERGQSLQESLELVGITLADLTTEITTPSR